jgi:DNA-binding response OmpR family regulator
VRISRLRQKLGDDPAQPRIVQSVRGVGYALNPEETAVA